MIEARRVPSAFSRSGPGVSSRNRHGENFLQAFENDFAAHGPRIIEQVRIEQPAIWLKIAGDLLPKETASQLGSNEFADLDPEAIMLKLAGQDLQGNLEHARWMYESLLKIASERAEPVS